MHTVSSQCICSAPCFALAVPSGLEVAKIPWKG